jgi:hypothetical protein
MTTRIPGVVTVTERAMRRLFSALAAEELGVTAGDVDARISDARGRLAVQLAGPIRIAPLGAPRAAGVLETAGAVRSRIVSDGQRLSGAEVDSVRVRVTGTRIQQTRRVA